jgi:hypothetical protein
MCETLKENTFRFSPRSFFSPSWRKQIQQLAISSEQIAKSQRKKKTYFRCGFCCFSPQEQSAKSIKTTTAHNMPLENLFHNHYTRRLQMYFKLTSQLALYEPAVLKNNFQFNYFV